MWVIGKNIYYIARVLFIGRHDISFSLLLLSFSFYFVREVRYRLLAYSLARLSFLFSTVTHLYQVPYQQLIIFRKTLVFFLFLCTRADKATISDFPRVRVAHSSGMRVWMRVILFLSLPFIYFFSIFYHFLHFDVVNAKNARERLSRYARWQDHFDPYWLSCSRKSTTIEHEGRLHLKFASSRIREYVHLWARVRVKIVRKLT